MEEFRHRLLRRRLKCSYESQQALASAVGVAWQTIQQWENGKTAPNRNRIKKVAEVLRTTSEWLLYGKGDEESSGHPSDPRNDDPVAEAAYDEIAKLINLYRWSDLDGRARIMEIANIVPKLPGFRIVRAIKNQSK